MATTNAGAFNVSRTRVNMLPDGSCQVGLVYSNVSTSASVVERTLTIPADSTKPITDQLGNVVTATVPAALANAITAFLAQLDTSIAAGATGGKLSL